MAVGKSVPGFREEGFTTESGVTWQAQFCGDIAFDPNAIIHSGATDSGSTPMTTLRCGLVVAKRDSDGKYIPYNPLGSAGAQQACGILVRETVMLNPTTGVVEDQFHGQAVMTSGRIKASALLGLDQQARNQLAQRFHFDDDNAGGHAPFRRVVDNAAGVTVTASQSGQMLTTAGASGAVVFTLPALAAGLRFMFLNVVDQNMTITSADANKLVGVNSVTSTSIAASTANQKIGAVIEVIATPIAGVLKWVAFNRSPGVVTMTLS